PHGELGEPAPGRRALLHRATRSDRGTGRWGRGPLGVDLARGARSAALDLPGPPEIARTVLGRGPGAGRPAGRTVPRPREGAPPDPGGTGSPRGVLGGDRSDDPGPPRAPQCGRVEPTVG